MNHQAKIPTPRATVIALLQLVGKELAHNMKHLNFTSHNNTCYKYEIND